jgi:hypothetical protein
VDDVLELIDKRGDVLGVEEVAVVELGIIGVGAKSGPGDRRGQSRASRMGSVLPLVGSQGRV